MAAGALVLSSRFGSRHLNWKVWEKLTVYPKLSLSFNRVKKNASSTMTFLLREMETGEVETVVDAKKMPRRFVSASYSDIFGLRKHHFFVITRDPYSRVLSAFLDKFRRDDYREEHGKFDLDPEGFASFVNWLAAGGLDKNLHWDLQKKQLFLPFSSFDSVIRFESLKADTVAMLEANGLRPPQGRLDELYPSDINKRTSATEKMQAFYSPRVADIVKQLYAEDFDTLGYEKNFVFRTR